ncbi:MAG: HD-GYP domain-containing protein [Candidatus Neomarinimicrobiota bacterium]
MIKKIKIEQLEIGMYVHDFNCGWMTHPFYQSQLLVKNSAILNKIVKAGIRELYIDTEKGRDLPDAPTAEEAGRQLTREFTRNFQKPVLVRKNVDSALENIPFEQEIHKAREVKAAARSHMGRVLNAAAGGRLGSLDDINPLVDNMVESITRNENALLSLLRVKKIDEYTYLHSLSVGALLIAFARFMKMSSDDIHNIGIGGLLHDIGKMQIPLEILNKPARLSDAEFRMIKDHVVQSARILEQNPDLDPIILQVASDHHERFDGTGYPRGLNGDAISLGGQMAAIVDVYDALSSDRIYHKGLSPAHTVKKMYEWSKYHFNPDLVHQFIIFIGIYPVGTVVRLGNGLVGVVIEANRTMPVVRVVYDTKTSRPIGRRTIDLASAMGQTTKIVSYEDPGQWGIDVAAVLEA